MTAPIVVLFDGVCNLCNGFVDFAIRRDPAQRLRFAAQQSPAGQRLLAQAGAADCTGETLVVLAGGRVLTRSAAALTVLRALRAPWPLLAGLCRAVPRGLRDALYTLVARRRYRWFGRRDTCRLPTADERARFLQD